jgi:hypothetical protein
MTPQQNDWQYLAEQASNEMDPEKLLKLVSQLNQVLGEREETVATSREWGHVLSSIPVGL